MYIIAGLGNPGRKYAKTRHNAGFDVVDRLADSSRIRVRDKKHHALCGQGVIAGEKVLLVKPQTYMNNSGDSIGEIIQYYKADPASELIVVYDDISLEPGRIRVRKKGSAGGHNGIKSIISRLGTQEFIRVRIGVGEKPEGWELADYVLGHMDRKERAAVEEAFSDAENAIALIVKGCVDRAMNDYNSGKRNV